MKHGSINWNSRCGFLFLGVPPFYAHILETTLLQPLVFAFHSLRGECSVVRPNNTADNCTLQDGEVIAHSTTRQVGCDVCGCKDGRLKCTQQRDCEVDKRYMRYTSYFIPSTVSYTHLRAHETLRYLVCRLLLEKKN